MKTARKQPSPQNAAKQPNIASVRKSGFTSNGPRAVRFLPCVPSMRQPPGQDKLKVLEIFPVKGEYPGPVTLPDGTEIPDAIVVIDDQAYINLIDAIHAEKAAAEKTGEPWEGLLIDQEHLSVMPNGDSKSFGWCKDLKKLEGQEGLCRLRTEQRGAAGSPKIRSISTALRISNSNISKANASGPKTSGQSA